MAAKDERTDYEKLIDKVGGISGNIFRNFINGLPVLSTGVFPVDMAVGKIDPVTGNGGIRARDIVEIMGVPGVGKTSLLYSMIVETQKRYPHRGSVVLVCSELPDIDRLERAGVDVEKLVLIGCYTPDTKAKQLLAEGALHSAMELARDPACKLIGIDSVSTLIPEKTDEKDIGESTPVAGLANIMNPFIGKFYKYASVAVLVMVSHYKESPNIGFSFVPTNLLTLKTSGGRNKEFLSMVRILVDGTAEYLKGPDGKLPYKHPTTNAKIQIGINITYQMIRNKYGNSDAFRTSKVYLDFKTGRFNNAEKTIDYASHFVAVDPVSKKTVSLLSPGVVQGGAWYTVGDQKFQGMDKAVAYLESHPELLWEIQKQLLPRSNEFFLDEKLSVSAELGV